MQRIDYEWRYYIGGNCSFTRRKGHDHLAGITHVEQGVYEAFVLREDGNLHKPWVLGQFDTPEEAQEVIEKVLEDVWEK